MSADVSQMPQSAIEAAREKINARNEEARQRGVKQGRAAERKDIYNEFGAQTLEDMRVLNRITAEIDQRWQREERKHGASRFWQGAAIFGLAGALGGLAAGIAAANLSQSAAFDSAAEYGARQVVTGAALGRAQQETDPARQQQEALEPQP